VQSLEKTIDEASSDHGLPSDRARYLIRAVIFLEVLGGSGIAIYYRLGPLRGLFRPATPPGGWVIDPPQVLRAVFALYAPVFFAWPAINRLKKRWREQDIARGEAIQPAVRLSLLGHIFGWLLLSFFAVLLIFSAAAYAFDYTTISRTGVRTWSVFGYVDHSFADINSITVLPDGYRLGNTATHGPKAWIQFDSGRETTFGEDNGLNQANVDAITHFIAAQSGAPIGRAPDAQPF
jgi:hypothetical protein